MKIFLPVITCGLLVAAVNADEPMKKSPAIEQITKFSETGNDQELAKQLALIKPDDQSPEKTADLLSAILVVADKFLSDNPKPEKIPVRNVSPPGGGVPGIDPASIADPKQREKYESLIEENRKLVEIHRKHTAVSNVKNKALNLLKIQRLNGRLTDDLFFRALDRQSESEEQKKSLQQQIRVAVFNQP